MKFIIVSEQSACIPNVRYGFYDKTSTERVRVTPLWVDGIPSAVYVPGCGTAELAK